MLIYDQGIVKIQKWKKKDKYFASTMSIDLQIPTAAIWIESIKFPGGPLVFEVGYHPRKKIHVIRVVFQNKAMYARTSFRGAKMCKIGKKGVFFGHIDKFWKGHDGQIKKNTCKNTYLGSIFIHEKYVFRVCFESPFYADDIQPEIQVAPPRIRLDSDFFSLKHHVAVTCDPLEVPEYGRFNHENCSTVGGNYEDVCVVQCEEGFQLTGVTERTCLGTGEWTDADANSTCVGMLNSAGPLNIVEVYKFMCRYVEFCRFFEYCRSS